MFSVLILGPVQYIFPIFILGSPTGMKVLRHMAGILVHVLFSFGEPAFFYRTNQIYFLQPQRYPEGF